MDTEVLIAMIEKEPAIWDKGCDEYKERIEKDRAWIIVANGVFEEWDSFSKEEQTKKINDIKGKWKNIKDAMQRNLQVKSGDCASKKKKYVHFEALSFLRTSAAKRSTSGNYEHGNTSDQDNEESADINDEEGENTSITSTPHKDASQSERKVVFKRPSKLPKITPFQESLLDSLNQATTKIPSSYKEPEDADKSYLLSLLPDYKALPTAKKWEFRSLVVNFFQNAYVNSCQAASQRFYSQNYYHPQWHGGHQQQSWTNNAYDSVNASPADSLSCTPSPSPQ